MINNIYVQLGYTLWIFSRKGEAEGFLNLTMAVECVE